ncbi:hypothetical protein B0H15DRAFT_942212 [Mycena belliarum]|uniref:Uncharacterized protein n=1 Tax=Mycena belliarum TaxID=1033014 RepID=A0AAD6ULR4_9AGAR|nr:hypothetical protein B0H15DRAFT_942212 [Mycena belliae]
MDSPTIEPARTPSLRSVASNASIGSTGLTRRSRTRTRSKTVSSPRPDVTDFRPPISPPLPTASLQVFSDQQVYSDHLVAEPLDISRELDQRNHDGTPLEAGPAQSKAAAQALRLANISTAPSAFSRVPNPSIPQLYDLGTGAGIRNSVHSESQGSFTHDGGSSSVYPPSTSTASGTESPPSPRSIAEQDDNHDISSFDPDLELQEFEADDVSYRLRLLVKNNYFLPPAHSKPSSSDFAASVTAKKASRAPTTPTFLDIFRKSRSKPTTPTAPPFAGDFFAPVLRTTSDATTVSAYSPHLPRRPSSAQGPMQQSGTPQDPSGRVVVVREKMHDLATAAKQAEQEMKSRGMRREESLAGHSEVDIIDPTDAVDLPPPSAAYPFAVQAAALNGMGVQDSVGAALLADRLPPRSPGGFSVDDDWRKALLHAAVDHSLNNTSPLSSPMQVSPISPVPDKRMLGQRIIAPPIIDDPQSSATSVHSLDDEAQRAPRPPSCLPLRVETPSMPMTPLAPPPRRLVNPLYSISQTSLINNLEPTARPPSSVQVLHTEFVPRLSNSYESGLRSAMMSPPLVSRESSESSHALPRTSVDSHESFRTEEDDGDLPRPSMSSSVQDPPRPSLSIYSQASPTTSAFQDAIGQPVLNPPPRTSSLRQSLEQYASSPSPVPRDSMASPPPRVSSSLAHITPLSPPPRSSSLAQRLASSSRMPPSLPISGPVLSDTPEELYEPGSTTPPFPISDRRGTKQLVLEIPRTNVAPSIRSAPAPSTPPSFFDSIQNQPNAMDDLDSSDSESDDESREGEPSPPHTPLPVGRSSDLSTVPPSTPSNVPSNVPSDAPSNTSSGRSLLMRLGNHSTPYVSRRPGSPGIPNAKKPVGNIPVSASFFTERRSGKSDHGHGPPTSTFDFYQYAKQHPLPPPEPNAPRRPHTSGEQSVRDWRSNQRAQESLRRLDGMLIQHMEAEKDTIKRIATNLQSNVRP